VSDARTVRLLLAYDGTDFHGWARQRNSSVRTVEGELCRHLKRVLRATPHVSVAGRTDAGVHAKGQVASFATTRRVTPERLQAALNGALAPEVVVREAAYAPAGFDARFSASAREYVYLIDTSPLPDPFTARYAWHHPKTIAISLMRQAAAHLVGEHDFTSFCRHPGQDRSTVRHVQRLTMRSRGPEIVITIRANAFLHQMVRAIVGTLVAVGEGWLEPDDVAAILEARSRTGTPTVAPSRGLTLDRVVYGRRTTY
jgi:tRNA pseudouridine38-40 synthase